MIERAKHTIHGIVIGWTASAVGALVGLLL